jgi:hypothetical protein
MVYQSIVDSLSVNGPWSMVNFNVDPAVALRLCASAVKKVRSEKHKYE